jgi:predicted transposase/invertase (TIGR01784 family)
MPKNEHIRFDWAMKRLLRQKTNFAILEGFLSELLTYDVRIQELLESESNQSTQEDKYNRVDILVKNDKDELMLIEVQNDREHDYFHRMNYGQAKLTAQYISEGDEYDKIKKIISINIVYFELGQGDDYVYEGRTEFKGIHTNNTLTLSKKQTQLYKKASVSDIFTTYYIIKVNNFDDIAKNMLDEWIYFLKNNEIKIEFKAKGIQLAKDKLRKDNLQGDEKIAYDIFVKNQRIWANEIKSAFFDGQVEARKELLPLIAEAQRQKEEAEQQKEEAQQQKEEAQRQKEDKERLLKQAEIEKEQAETEKKQAEIEKKQAETEKIVVIAQSVKLLSNMGMNAEAIALALQIDLQVVLSFLA